MRTEIVRAVVLFALATAGAFGCTTGYTPVLRPGPNIPDTSYVMPAPTEGLRLLVFNTGMNRMSQVMVGDVRPWRPNPAFVVQHPTHGLIVFDTGWPAEIVERGEYAIPSLIESVNNRDRMLDDQMMELGLNPADVRYVVVSHLHDDHTGRVTAFPNAILIGGPSTEAALAKLAPAAKRMSIDFNSGPKLPPFDETHDLFADGSVILVHGGGHTKEDVMVLIALPNGPALLTGDAIVHRDWLASDDVQRIVIDPDRAAVVRNQVRALLRGTPELALYPGHDTPPPTQRTDVTVHHPDWFELAAWRR